MGVSLHDHLPAAVREREPRGEVALRGAVDQEPRPPRPPGLGGERLRLGEGGRLGAEVDAVGERGDVERQRPLAERLEQAVVGALAALVAGDVQPRRLAPRVRAKRIQIRRAALALLLGAQDGGASTGADASFGSAGETGRRCSAYMRIACAPAGCSRARRTMLAVAWRQQLRLGQLHAVARRHQRAGPTARRR